MPDEIDPQMAFVHRAALVRHQRMSRVLYEELEPVLGVDIVAGVCGMDAEGFLARLGAGRMSPEDGYRLRDAVTAVREFQEAGAEDWYIQRWMITPHDRLGGRAPVAHLASGVNRNLVDIAATRDACNVPPLRQSRWAYVEVLPSAATTPGARLGTAATLAGAKGVDPSQFRSN